MSTHGVPGDERLEQITVRRYGDVWYATGTVENVTGRAHDRLQAEINYLEFVRDSNPR